jgi:hypothetical protein
LERHREAVARRLRDVVTVEDVTWSFVDSVFDNVQTVLIPAKWPPTRLRVTLQKRW